MVPTSEAVKLPATKDAIILGSPKNFLVPKYVAPAIANIINNKIYSGNAGMDVDSPTKNWSKFPLADVVFIVVYTILPSCPQNGPDP